MQNRSDSDQLRENMKPEDARRRQWILREQRDEARAQRDELLAALADAIEKATPKGDQ